jgi:hypothetical protein
MSEREINTRREIAARCQKILLEYGRVGINGAGNEVKSSPVMPRYASSEDFRKFGLRHSSFRQSAGGLWYILARQYARDALWENPLIDDLNTLPIEGSEIDTLKV